MVNISIFREDFMMRGNYTSVKIEDGGLNSDCTMDQLFELFRQAALGCGYSEETFNKSAAAYAEEEV